MKAWRKARFGRVFAESIPVSQKNILPLLATVSLFIWLLLARHTSTEPTVFGRWSSRYAILLAFQGAMTIAWLLPVFPPLNHVFSAGPGGPDRDGEPGIC